MEGQISISNANTIHCTNVCAII